MLKVLFTMIASGAFGVLFNVRGRNLVYAGINGGLGYMIYLLMVNVNNFAALFLASSTITLYAEIFARIHKAPATLFLVAGLIPIVPGGGLFNCALKLLEGGYGEAASIGISTLLEAGAIAFGIIMIASIIKLLPPVFPKKIKNQSI